MSRILVLEKWKVTINNNDQRLVYDAVEDRIIHQFRSATQTSPKWTEDTFTALDHTEIWANTYLIDFNNDKG
jgi:hypothetical protein